MGGATIPGMKWRSVALILIGIWLTTQAVAGNLAGRLIAKARGG